MKVLVVEDNLELLETYSTALVRAGHRVDTASTYSMGRWLDSEHDYDLLILDWILPEGSGLSLCQHHRNRGKTTPVLMLTARDSIPDKVQGLDAGADDYVIKPIDIAELLARVRALGRRIPQWQGDELSLGSLRLHWATLTVSCGEQQARLSLREAQLLEYFLRHPRQILSRAQIEQALWSWQSDLGDNAVTVQTRRLRQRLQSIGAAGWIKTIYGAGYQMVPPHEESLCTA